MKNKIRFLAGWSLFMFTILLAVIVIAVGADNHWTGVFGTSNLTESCFNINDSGDACLLANGTEGFNTTLTAVLFNFTINNTVNGAVANQNITEINITIPSNWSYVVDTANMSSLLDTPWSRGNSSTFKNTRVIY